MAKKLINYGHPGTRQTGLPLFTNKNHKARIVSTEAPLLPATTHGLDREKLKRFAFSIKKEYNQITFGLKIVREHMGGMMSRIRELDGILKNSEK